MTVLLPDKDGRRFFVLGYAKSGAATAAALKANGADVFVWDDKQATRDKAVHDGYQLADPATFDFNSTTTLVPTPGVPLSHPSPHEAIVRARTKGCSIISDLDLLFEACPRATYVGITGTNGKSTTTALIAHILKQAGRSVQMGGNIGTPVLSLDPLGAGGIYVLELSSFQLDLMRDNPLAVAVWLNVTPDHLDRHGDMEGYIAAKKRIVRTDAIQTLILGTDEPAMRTLYTEFENRRNLTVKELSSQRDVVRGIRQKGLKLYITNDSLPLDLAVYKSLPGAHNAQNAAAAFAVCQTLGLTRAEIETEFSSFPGLTHRQQLVAEIGGIRFINDSKATNADAASKALGCYDSIYWIIGGKAKAGGLSGLEPFASRVSHAFLIGAASDEFATWCVANKIAFTPCMTLDVAVEKAATMAWDKKIKGAVVLLSPACASFDQFASFEERGERFISLVHALEQKV